MKLFFLIISFLISQASLAVAMQSEIKFTGDRIDIIARINSDQGQIWGTAKTNINQNDLQVRGFEINKDTSYFIFYDRDSIIGQVSILRKKAHWLKQGSEVPVALSFKKKNITFKNKEGKSDLLPVIVALHYYSNGSYVTIQTAFIHQPDMPEKYTSFNKAANKKINAATHQQIEILTENDKSCNTGGMYSEIIGQTLVTGSTISEVLTLSAAPPCSGRQFSYYIARNKLLENGNPISLNDLFTLKDTALAKNLLLAVQKLAANKNISLVKNINGNEVELDYTFFLFKKLFTLSSTGIRFLMLCGDHNLGNSYWDEDWMEIPYSQLKDIIPANGIIDQVLKTNP